MAMKSVSIADPEFTYDDGDPEGFRAGMFRLGPLLGAQHTGTSVYEIGPGQALCPYHYEYGEEEWLLVLAGRATVRHPEGTTELGPMEVTCFVRGPAGAHQVRNDADATLRVLMWSEVVVPTATVYPDSDKIGVWTGNRTDDGLFRRGSAVGYYD
jgi:uncharacterized cupin superfamily protein